MFLYIILAVLGFLVCCFTVFMLSYYEWHSPAFHRRCLKIPHPQLSFITGVGSELIKYPIDDILSYAENLWKSTGNVFYFPIMGIPNVMIVNPEDIEVLLSNIKYAYKGAEYRLFRSWIGNGLVTSSGNHWHVRRKQLTPSFHFKNLEVYLRTINKHAKNLTKELAGTGGRPISIEPVILSCVLSIIYKTAMGTTLDMTQNTVREYASSAKELLDTIAVRILTFWWQSDWVFALSPIGRRYSKNLRKVLSFVENVIKERREITAIEKENIATDSESGRYKQRKSFLDILLSIQRENPASISDEDIRDEVNAIMFGGYDTVGAAIGWTLFLLANHPEVQDRVRDEINEVFPPDDSDFSMQDLSKLKYLEMVMKESLRLYPSVPYMTRRIPVDMKIVTGGHVIPAGANVVVMPYLVHRNPDVFEDPEKFDPERFAPEMARTYHPYAYIPFSAGYRNCIGQKFAVMEEKVILATILRKFHVSSAQRREDVKVVPSVVLHPCPEIELSFHPVGSDTPAPLSLAEPMARSFLHVN